ncbi:OprO/OprP family phosphate-selective porin [Bradyrhizobium canariense]|uniref:Phosphate-selective porin OprO and OprP n=1 Tax=Bradyrhizobium canariense TaxID=255045 RepID=A0A1H1Y2P6_9BRAD|nr:OprO/OprP family phosphate-selective porin [Bradyrhizobium canariense]SDT15256.1 phosphate-selective porin OprO and OprP [Bradyrhizobium canariense]
MSTARLTTAAAISLIPVLITSQAQAGDNDAEIALLKQQLKLMEQKLDKLQKQTAANTAEAAKTNAKVDAKVVAVANPNAAYPIKGPIAPSDAVVHMPNNRPTICTADEQNCVSITSRVHFDVGGYDYRPNTAATSPQKLDDGVNLRRARIGVLGKFLGDWNYALIYDFGGSSDGFASTASIGAAPGVAGTSVGFLPGGALAGIEQAYLSYTGFKPFGGKLAIEGGYMDTLYTLDEATSSNDIMFMERASSGIIAQNIAAGDFRSAGGARWYTDTFWIGAYATGPTAGAIHSASSLNPNGATEQLGSFARAAGQVISGKDYSLHIGADAEFLIDPSRNQVTGAQTLTLSDRPELRLDPTSLISTGALAGVSGAQVYSAEAAGTYGPLFFQGEYFWYNVDRSALPGLSSVKFDGGYAEASYVLTGETHTYNSSLAAYNGIVPANPFSLEAGGWGAWEIAGRVSTVDLNDQLASANGVAGGRQTVYTAGLNWYANRNVRFMLNYLHGDITKQVSATNFGDTGAKFDAVAMRTQVAF